MKNNKRKNNKKKNVRGRSEIGNTGATAAIRQYDRYEAAREVYLQTKAESTKREPWGYFPSLEEAEQNFKIDPTDRSGSRLLCNLEDNKWKIVLTKKEFYAIAIKEAKKRSSWTTFEHYKAFMHDKYYVPDVFLDALLPREPKDGEGQKGE